jgi:hypothetical protein
MLMSKLAEDLEGWSFRKVTGRGFVLGVSERWAAGADGRGKVNRIGGMASN